jgi:dimethylargininase
VSTRFSRAVLRRPGANFASGITASEEGPPELEAAVAQHAAYAGALEGLGLSAQILPADPAFPDGVFVEDTAIIVGGSAVITRPGAAARAGETAAVERALSAWFPEFGRITSPGTLDAGDVCETDDLVLIGVSHRTDEAGAQQLAAILDDLDRRTALVDIRSTPGLLHLKTGLSYLGEGRMAIAPGLDVPDVLKRFELVFLEAEERYAANCLAINGRVLIPAGAPRFADRLAALGYAPQVLEMSEFRKMDGGLSCLSLRF